MSLEANLTAANAAVEYVKGLNIKSSNKLSDRIAAAGGIDKVIGTEQGMRTRRLGMAGVKVREVRQSTTPRAAEKLGYGNCYELAHIAANYLVTKPVRPIHVMVFDNRNNGYDHVWVVIGLAADFKANILRSWGAEAVWCDPWQGDGVAFSINDFIKGKVRNLNVMYKCNTVERVEAGNPKITLNYN